MREEPNQSKQPSLFPADPWDDLGHRLSGPLRLEKRLGFKNNAVQVIGFSAFVRKVLLETLPRLAPEKRPLLLPFLEKSGLYPGFDRPGREEFVEGLLRALTSPAPPPRDSPLTPQPSPFPDPRDGKLTEIDPPAMNSPIPQKRTSPEKNGNSPPPRRESAKSPDLAALEGVGPKILAELHEMGIFSLSDLVRYFPFRYEDRKNFPVSLPGTLEPICVYGEILRPRLVRLRGKKEFLFQVELATTAGTIQVRWFHMGFLAKNLTAGKKIVCFGKFDPETRSMAHPEFEHVDRADLESLNFGRLVPMYGFPSSIKRRRLSAKLLRSLVHQSLEKLGDPEVFPAAFLGKHGLMPRKEALKNIHFPDDQASLAQARRRFAFDDLFLLLHAMAAIRARQAEKTARILSGDMMIAARELSAALPFRLTHDQETAFQRLRSGLASGHPFRILLQGDVGCGKTILVFLAAALLAREGCQSLFMAPTSLLAGQHHQLVAGGGPFQGLGLRSALLTSATGKRERLAIQSDWKEGRIDLLIGTHALLHQDLPMEKVGLAAIDEQHKFGVDQRLTLVRNSPSSHLLFLSATPIPRTLALALYGHLEVLTLRERPRRERNLRTSLHQSNSLTWLVRRIQAFKEKKQKAFFLCPLVAESEKVDLANVEERAESLRREAPDLRIGILHGRLPNPEKEEALARLRDGGYDLLVVTSVIEVGIDIPDASLLIVENAERFGLAQLHQMRGRIGRRGQEAECILWSTSRTTEALHRLDCFRNQDDGFLLAEEDLKIRGPGDFFGEDQSGVPRRILSRLVVDPGFVDQVRAIVESDPGLPGRYPLIRAELNTFLGDEGFKAFLLG